MLAGLPVAIAMFAQAASVPAAPPTVDPVPAAIAAPRPRPYGPVAPAPPRPKAVKTAASTQTCAQIRANADTREIIVCAQQGYRLDPDVMEAKREARSGGPPRRPENFKDYPCAHGIGPAPCFDAGINLIAAALTAAEMAKRLAEGKEIGSMFKTTPTPTEYQLYVAAKARREAAEAEAAAEAAARAKAAQPAQPVAADPVKPQPVPAQ